MKGPVIMSKIKTSNFGKNKSSKATPGENSRPAAGGELHQIAGGVHPTLTTNQGIALSDIKIR